MQHHPGSWYIPWGVPLQKMLTVPFNASAAAAAAATAGYHQPQIATAAVAQQPQHHQPGQPQPQTYHHQPHPQLLSNGAPLQYQPMHPAASAMFTPLTLRNLVGHPHHLHSMQQQQQQQQTPLIGATHQQPPQQQTAATLTASQQQSQLTALNINGVSVLQPVRQPPQHTNITSGSLMLPMKKVNYIIFSIIFLFHFIPLFFPTNFFFKFFLKQNSFIFPYSNNILHPTRLDNFYLYFN